MYRLKLSNASSTNGWSNRLWRNCQFSRFAKFVKIGKWRKDSIGLSRRNAGPIKWTVHTNKSFNPSQGPIEVMTAINCSHRRVHETRWKRKRKRKRKREREGPRFLVPSRIGPDRRNGPRGPGPRIPDSSFPFPSSSSSSSAYPSSYSCSLHGRCVSLWIVSLSLVSRRTCNSDATSLRSQMEDPVPGIERVKHRLKACFPSGNRWENNGPTAPKVSDKCSARVAHRVLQHRGFF